jgi:hypothetical protein
MNPLDPRKPQGANPPDPTLRDLLAPLFRRKVLLGLVFFGTLLAAVLVAVIGSFQYKASMKILVNRQRVDPMVSSESTLQQPLQPPPVTDEEINSEVVLLQSGCERCYSIMFSWTVKKRLLRPYSCRGDKTTGTLPKLQNTSARNWILRS